MTDDKLLLRECRSLLAEMATEYEIGDEASELQHWPKAEVERCRKAVELRERLDARLSHPEPAAQTHPNTDRCGFDRNGSINANHYVCMCGWEDSNVWKAYKAIEENAHWTIVCDGETIATCWRGEKDARHIAALNNEPAAPHSRSQLRRIAAQRGEPAMLEIAAAIAAAREGK